MSDFDNLLEEIRTCKSCVAHFEQRSADPLGRMAFRIAASAAKIPLEVMLIGYMTEYHKRRHPSEEQIEADIHAKLAHLSRKDAAEWN